MSSEGPFNKLITSLSDSLEQFETVSVNLDRLTSEQKIDAKDYAEARMLISSATTSAVQVQQLIKSTDPLGIEEQDAVLEQVTLINETLEYCREAELLC